MTIGELIKQYREDHKLSQRQFAELCGDVTNGYISMVEQGKNPSTGKPIIPSIDKLAAFARGMGMSLHQLVEMTDDSFVYIGESDEDNKGKKKGSKEWRVLSEGFERMEKQEYDSFMAYFKMLTTTRPDLFNERNDDDDTES